MTLNDAVRAGIIGTDSAEVRITPDSDGGTSFGIDDFTLGFGWCGARDKDDAENFLNDAVEYYNNKNALNEKLSEDCVDKLWDMLQDIMSACWNCDLDWLAENTSNNSIVFHGVSFGFNVDVFIDGMFF